MENSLNDKPGLTAALLKEIYKTIRVKTPATQYRLERVENGEGGYLNVAIPVYPLKVKKKKRASDVIAECP